MRPIGNLAVRLCAGLLALAHPGPTRAACQLAKYLDLPVTMRGRRPIVAAQIDGKDIALLLDSGAFYSLLSRPEASRLGLRLGPLPAAIRLRGVNGEADASLAVARNFGLGAVTLPSVEFIVGGTDMGLSGLLGQNFLHIGDVEYDLPHGAVRLLKATGCQAGQYVYWAGSRPVTMVPLEADTASHQTHTVGTVLVNGVKLHAVFDSGASSSVLSMAAAKKVGLTPNAPGVVLQGYSTGLGGRSTRTWRGSVTSIDIGGEVIRNPHLEFGEVDLGEDDMLIGADFFLTHRIYVSNRQQKMFVTYEGGPLFGLTPQGAVTSTGQRIDLSDKSEAPTDAEGYARRGAVALSNGRAGDAIDDLTKAIEAAPGQARYLRQRAAARLANGQPLLAANDLDRALEIDPADVDARGMRATLRLRARDPDGALADLRALDASLPANAAQRLSVAGLEDAAGRPELALANYDSWLKSHPGDAARAVALNGRCWARAQLGRELDAALDDCNAALRLRPGNAAILDSRALVRFRHGDFAAALDDYDAAVKADPRAAWSLYARGLVKAKLGDAAGAKADRDAALKLDGRLPARASRLGLSG